jgi:hypothetical protein
MAKKTIFGKMKGWIGKKLAGIIEAADEENPLARTIKKVGFSFMEGERSDFQESPFELEDIDAAYNTDSYVRQALDKYIELMFKSGWNIKYKNEKVKEYIKKRFSVLADSMGSPIDQFWKELSEDLVKYSNVFLIKARKDPADVNYVNGLTYKGLGDKDPVAGYFRQAPSTISIQVDKHGTVSRYKQVVGENEKTFKKEDVVHIYFKKPAGRFFGVPLATPVLDDVRLLREVEDNVARLIYRHLNPLYLYRVGIDKPGYEATDEEIEYMKQQIENMPTEGGLVIPERHDVNILGAEKEALDAEKYLKYFERRVFTGFGTPETVMGRGDTSNRSTAESQSSEMRDSVRAYQTVVEDFINHFIMRELLLEGGFDPILNPEDIAEFEFNEIDVDLKIKIENHSIYKYEHNAITHDEMRQELGFEPLSDLSRLNGNMFNSDSSDTDNREDPENQHSNNKEYFNKMFGSNNLEEKMSAAYLQARREIIDNTDFYYEDVKTKEHYIKEAELSLNLAEKKIRNFVKAYSTKAYKRGFEAAESELNKNLKAENSNVINEELDKYLKQFFESIKDSIVLTLNKENKYVDIISKQASIFSALEYKLYYLSRNFLMSSYNLGFANAGKEAGKESLSYVENEKIKVINFTDGIFDKLPNKKPVGEFYLTYKKLDERGLAA